jgi:UDP-N-acetylmuramoylalanine--D-glutamate ligase
VQKRIPLVLGFGMTGQSILNYLSKKYNEIYLIEDWEENPSLREIDRFGIKVHVNPQINSELFSKISDVYSSPGIPIQHKALSLASKHKINIFSDIEEFLKINKSIKILITGTNGKTSTCQILETLLRSVFSDLKIVSVGNIGKPVLNYIDNDIDVSIIEVSSFQLELLNEVEFDIGLLLNIEEDHLDKHADIEDYRNVKNSVLKKADINISYNDRNLFSKTFLNYKTIILPNELAESSIFNNWPSHDIENLKACVAVLEAFIERFRKSSIGNINLFAELEKAFDQFKKFPHRFEHLEMVGGVNFINDSKATNLDATLKAIHAASELEKIGDIYLICGGDLKGQEIASKEMQEIKSLKKVFIFGKDKELIFNTLRQYAHCMIVQDLKQALIEAVKFTKDDDCVLFSPACSSLDMFKDYKDRGETFKRLIKDLDDE